MVVARLVVGLFLCLAHPTWGEGGMGENEGSEFKFLLNLFSVFAPTVTCKTLVARMKIFSSLPRFYKGVTHICTHTYTSTYKHTYFYTPTHTSKNSPTSLSSSRATVRGAPQATLCCTQRASSIVRASSESSGGRVTPIFFCGLLIGWLVGLGGLMLVVSVGTWDGPNQNHAVQHALFFLHACTHLEPLHHGDARPGRGEVDGELLAPLARGALGVVCQDVGA